MLEDQIIGAICIIALLALIGISTHKPKKIWGENFPGAKYSKGRK